MGLDHNNHHHNQSHHMQYLDFVDRKQTCVKIMGDDEDGGVTCPFTHFYYFYLQCSLFSGFLLCSARTNGT